MKKYLYFLLVALFATMSFALTSCGDDDDEPTGSEKIEIIGTWKSTTVLDEDGWTQTDYVQFKDGGSYVNVILTDLYGMEDKEVSKGTWSVNGNKITTKTEAGSFTSTIKNSTKDLLIIEALGEEMTYKRVSDSEINKYL